MIEMTAPASDAAARIRILVVDDEVQNLTTFQRVWRKHYEIETATSGAAGLALLADREFDVVLTDYCMPLMDGETFTRKARTTQDVAIVMITGYLDTPGVRALVDAGELFSVLGKPWHRDAVLDVVARASERTQAIRAGTAAR